MMNAPRHETMLQNHCLLLTQCCFRNNVAIADFGLCYGVSRFQQPQRLSPLASRTLIDQVKASH